MKIPNLPTDSLYKFMALFGLIVMIVGSYLYVQYRSGIQEEIKEYIQNRPPNPSEIDFFFNQDSLRSEAVNFLPARSSSAQQEFINALIESESFWESFYQGILIFGFAISLLGFILWYIKGQRYNDEIIRHQAHQLQNDKAIYVHELQFKKEFEAYEQLWPNLEGMIIQGKRLSEKFSSEERDEEDFEHLYKFLGLFDPINKILQKYRPFLPLDIYDATKKLMSVILKIEQDHSSNTAVVEHNLSEWSQEVGDNLKILMGAIHQRLGLLQVID